ncbi:hypothetical protein [Aestuariivirga sp.]|uniref:hypothetical protein n=1 Tax=Aestuariivirga sp. TaxID=2650926 RepID=UPI00359491BC
MTISSTLRTAALSFTVTLTACCAAFISPALADDACEISQAAGKPVPARASGAETGQFRIFWQISTQIEDVADAAGNPAALKDIREARALSDGYYINTLLAGPLIYWPGRPKQCALNKKVSAGTEEIELDGEFFTPEGGTATRDACARTQEEFVRKTGKYANAREMQIDALKRVFRNLDLVQEQKRGKLVWGEQLVTTEEFSYDRSSDKVRLNQLPRTYCVMNSVGITLDNLMLYMEPGLQTKKNNFVWIPLRGKNGKLKDTQNARQAKIPENVHAFNLITQSFAAADVPVGGFRPNIRRWNEKRSPRLVKELAAQPDFAGFNFEGGTAIMPGAKNLIDNYVEGISWILMNTDKNVSMLMPGYWPRDMVGNEEEVDQLVTRLRELITGLNQRLGKKMGTKNGNAICSNRINLVVASYGQPIHVKTLPMRRGDGRLAGTVTGQIKLLSDVRKELCGG